MPSNHERDQESQSAHVSPTPLPKFQLFMVALMQGAEPITATVIYPFIAPLVAHTGVTKGDEKAIGYYAGIIESVFFFAESASVYHWALASDYYGRKPILVLGPIGLALAMLGFGLSTSFWPLVFFRALQGCFNGLIGVSKTVMAELTDSTNSAAAFSMIPIMWSAGVTIGPLIGGLLSNPAWKWALFDTSFFHQYPYFLPCAVAGFLALLAGILGAIYLQETSPRFRKQAEKPGPSTLEASALVQECPVNYGAVSCAAAKKPSQDDVVEAPPPLRELFTPSFIAILACYAFLAFLDMSYQVLIPLVYSSSHAVGGLAFPPALIGQLLASVAIGGATMQIIFMPKIIKRFDMKHVYFVTMCCIGTSTMCLAAMSWVVRRTGRVTPVVWLLIATQLLCGLAYFAAYTSIQLLIVANSTRASVASANSVAQMIATLVRGLSPGVASSLYSASLSKNLLGGYLVYAVLGTFFVGALKTALNLPRTR